MYMDKSIKIPMICSLSQILFPILHLNVQTNNQISYKLFSKPSSAGIIFYFTRHTTWHLRIYTSAARILTWITVFYTPEILNSFVLPSGMNPDILLLLEWI